MRRIIRFAGWILLLATMGAASGSPPVQAAQTSNPTPTPGEAQPLKWSAPLNISRTPGKSWLPTATADRAGNVHVVWAEWANRDSQTSDTVYYTMWNGQTWSRPAAIAVTGGGPASLAFNAVWHPVIAADGFGTLHLAWTDTHSIYYSQAEIEGEPWNTQAWTSPRAIFPNSGAEGKFPDIAVDSQQNIHLVFNASGNSYYMKSSDGGQTWSAPVTIGEPLDIPTRPRIVVDDQGLIHIGITETNGMDNGVAVLYSRSPDGGKTWDISRRLSDGTNGRYPDRVSLGIDGQGVLHAVWPAEQDFVFYHRYSTNRGLTWSEPQIMAKGIAGYGWPAMATDSAGTLHLLLSVDHEILHYEWTGKEWTSPENISRSSTFSEMPSLVITGGNQLHAIWMDYTEGQGQVSDAGNMEVNYSTAMLPIPGIAAEGFLAPPPTAAALPTAPATGTPSPPATATRLPAFPSTTASPDLQAGQTIPLLVGVLPVGLLLVFILLLRGWRRAA